MCHHRVALVVLAGVLLEMFSASPSPAQTAAARQPQAPPPTGAWVRNSSGQLGASVNNLGLQQLFDVSWRRALTQSANPLLSEAHVSFGGTAAVTPAHVRGGGWMEVVPLSVLTIRAGAEPAYYFGTFDSLMSFASRSTPFDNDTRKARSDEISGTATRVYLTPSVQFRAGPIVGRTSLDLERWTSSAPGPFFYEATRDTLLNVDGDRLTTVTTAVLYERQVGDGQWRTGGMHSLLRVNGWSGASLNQIHRLGAVVIREWEGRLLGVPKPSLTLAMARYLDDPSKRHEWTGAMAIGFGLR
jgi:hypothetical protein